MEEYVFSQPPPPPEDDNYIDSPPPPKTSSSPPPPSPPVSRAPPPPETKILPPPPSKSKDNPPPEPNPPPDASPPPPSSATSPPPPSSSSPPPPSTRIINPPPIASNNPPPTVSNNPPPIASNNPSPIASNNPPRQSESQPNSDKLPSPSLHVPPANIDSPGSIPSQVGSSPGPPSPLTSETTNSASSSSSNNQTVAVIAGVSVAGVLVLALIIVGCLCCARKKKRQYYYDKERQPNAGAMGTPVGNGGGTNQWGGTPTQHMNYSNEYNQGNSGQHPHSIPPPSPMSGLGFSQCQFSYQDLATATSGFSQANLLGQGGFGYVHKGVLPDGKVVAVKSLKSGSGQGEREFQAEVEIISRVHHRHLVSLVGYCIADGQRMLVYEFVANQTMEHHLHGKGQPVMDWSSRLRIAIGSAKGLAYLHEDCHPRIIHRDIKAANILLDENFEAMVADFGLAKLTTDNSTHVSTRVMGTFGYLAPEYASSGKLTEKSDVFSFGVMLLELITGRRPVDLTGQIMEDSLADWARPLLAQALESENYNELVDPRLEGNYTPHEMASMISCAAASTRHSAKRRPKMSQIVRALEGDMILVEESSEVGKAVQGNNTNGSSSHDSAYDTVAYNADMMKFRNMVLNSEDVGTTSEYGATSEYGLNTSDSSSSNNSREMGAHSGQHKLKY